MVRTVELPPAPKLRRLIGIVKVVLAGKPLYSYYTFHRKVADTIQEVLSSHDYDVVQLEHTMMGLYADCVSKSTRAKMVLDLHNISYVQYRRIYAVEKNPRQKLRLLLTWLPLRRLEAKIARKFDRCITMSTSDADILLDLDPQVSLSVVPTGVDLDQLQLLPPNPASRTILFVGSMAYDANVDGVGYFLRSIMPIIWQEQPQITFMIVGPDPPREIREMAADQRVIVTGRVDDLRPYYAQSVVCVVPLRAGGGIRLKILEAMALGRPVVSTSLGCEGLEVTHNRNILDADTPEDFAAHTLALISDTRLRKRIVKDARAIVEAGYSWAGMARDLGKVYEELARDGRGDKSGEHLYATSRERGPHSFDEQHHSGENIPQ